MKVAATQPLPPRECIDDDERLARAEAFAAELALRRTVREFSDRPVAHAVIEAVPSLMKSGFR